MISKSESSPIETQCWSIVIYKVPSTPSTARVTVWKKIKELGALPLQQSVYLLPKLPVLVDALDELKKQIEGFGGECKILEMASLEGAQEKEMINGFNALRNQEFEEILDECEAFDQEIDKETKAGKYYFAEEEEIEKRLEGLIRWFDTVVKRDFFDAELRPKVAKTLSDCRVRLDAFSQEVFSHEQTSVGDSKGSAFISKLKDSPEGKKKVRETHRSDELVARLKEIVTEIEKGSLMVGDEQVRIGTGQSILQMRYKPHEGSRSLEIEIDWEDTSDKPE